MKHYILYLLIILASCNSGKKEDDTAIMVSKETEMKKLISKYPDSVILRETLVQYYREIGNYDQAITETNDLLKRDSTNPELYYIKASLHFEDEDTLKAINALEKAISIIPEPKYLISLGRTYAQTKNEKALALADFLIRIDRSKTEVESLFIKGLYYNFINGKEKAISFFDKALQLNFTFMDAYREKAIALYDLGKYNESLAVLDKAVTLQNNFDEGYYYRGKVLEKLNRRDEAIESYQLALKYDPNYIEAKDALSKLGMK